MRPFLYLTLLAVPTAGALAFAVPAATLQSRAGMAAPVPSAVAAPPVAQGAPRGVHAFYFTRGIYTDARGGFGGRGSWAVDWPKSDQQFLSVLRRLTNLDAYNSDHVVRLDDPELRRFPFLYMLEVGRISLTPAEVTGLREYLLAGGFAFIDDFWGEDQWAQFEWQMKQVLPEHPIVDVPMDHPIFNTFYQIKSVQQMPSIGHWRSGQSTECYGCNVAVRGILDDTGRVMMLIHWNSDNGDAWEWAEQPDIPLKFTTYAYQIGINAVVYSMSH